ncbi:hypothetical protein AVEN_16416-1 [Araneus ventricosus]|uniref:Uncharacterized protein n=1 Tax=Araneus ventricosus TaxID=182803 RepID=A0A4Y2F2J5_ARAVE|nr:hypothetical protein AVEN_16416-1 [Araneus ventricosus]
MMSDHAYSKALRAHFLTFEISDGKLLKNSLQELNEETKCIIRDSIHELMATNKRSIEDLKGNIHIKQLLGIVEKAATVGNFSRTARLWLQYIEQVKFILLYIQADRVGD